MGLLRHPVPHAGRTVVTLARELHTEGRDRKAFVRPLSGGSTKAAASAPDTQLQEGGVVHPPMLLLLLTQARFSPKVSSDLNASGWCCKRKG